MSQPLRKEVVNFGLEIITGQLSTLTLVSTLLDDIQKGQDEDPNIQKIKQGIQEGEKGEFRISDCGMLYYGNHLCVPNQEELRKKILDEAHRTPYAMHPGSTKMYQDLKERFWWSGMKRDVARYISTCMTCQRVKAEHQRPGGVLQSIQILEWK